MEVHLTASAGSESADVTRCPFDMSSAKYWKISEETSIRIENKTEFNTEETNFTIQEERIEVQMEAVEKAIEKMINRKVHERRKIIFNDNTTRK